MSCLGQLRIIVHQYLTEFYAILYQTGPWLYGKRTLRSELAGDGGAIEDIDDKDRNEVGGEFGSGIEENR
jgi:hypothetical protein